MASLRLCHENTVCQFHVACNSFVWMIFLLTDTFYNWFPFVFLQKLETKYLTSVLFWPDRTGLETESGGQLPFKQCPWRIFNAVQKQNINTSNIYYFIRYDSFLFVSKTFALTEQCKHQVKMNFGPFNTNKTRQRWV